MGMIQTSSLRFSPQPRADDNPPIRLFVNAQDSSLFLRWDLDDKYTDTIRVGHDQFHRIKLVLRNNDRDLGVADRNVGRLRKLAVLVKVVPFLGFDKTRWCGKEGFGGRGVRLGFRFECPPAALHGAVALVHGRALRHVPNLAF